MKKEYYVYVLIDPRDNQIFYVGKGKGTRYKSHLSENFKDTRNIYKYSRIKDIQSEGLEVKTEILFPYLDEKSSFELEKIIIYKLGRKILNEGKLLNITPGGVWKRGDTIFYEDRINMSFDLNKLDFVGQSRFLEIKKVSNIIHLNEITPKFRIHKYGLNGKLKSIKSLNNFFKDIYYVDLFMELLNEDSPIFYKDYIYSKSLIQDFYFSENLPYYSSYIVDSIFFKDFDKKLKFHNDFELKLIRNNLIRIMMVFKDNIISFHTYYSNGMKKSLRQSKNGISYGERVDWNESGKQKSYSKYNEKGKSVYSESYNEDGILKNKDLFFDNGYRKESNYYFNDGTLEYHDEYQDRVHVSRKMYYKTGKLNYSYNNFDGSFFYEKFDKDGVIQEKLFPGRGYVKYNIKGDEISTKSTKHFLFIDPFKILLSFDIVGDNKFLPEKLESDEDWEQYIQFMESEENNKKLK